MVRNVTVLVALVAFAAALAEAKKFSGLHHGEFEGDHLHGGHLGEFGNHHHGGRFEDEEFGHGHRFHGGQGGFRRGGHVQGGFHEGGSGLGHRLRRRGGLRGGVGGVGAGIVGGAHKGIRGHEGHLNHLHNRNSGHIGGHADLHRNDIHGSHNRHDAEHFNAGRNENDGIHKHQVINKDKTFVRDRTTGVNDVDGFHNSNSHLNGGHVGSEHDNFDSHNVGGSIGGNAGFNKEFDATNAGEHSGSIESDVGGAAGIGALGGAAL